jgi:hypothetical protein
MKIEKNLLLIYPIWGDHCITSGGILNIMIEEVV